MVETDVEKNSAPLSPFEGLGGPADSFRGLALTEEEIAVPVAPDREEDRVCGLVFHLKLLSFTEEARSPS